jgi:hypothetical protein
VTRAREVSRAKLRASVDAGHPDLVEETARRLLKQELERISGRSEKGPDSRSDKDEERRPPTALRDTDFAVHIHAEAKELESMARVSMLKLELEEGTLDRITISEGEEAGLE